MTDSLSDIFAGPLAKLGQTLTLPDDTRTSLSFDAYLAPDTLEENLQRFAPQYIGADRRALVSIWVKYHFLRLVPAVVAASLLHNWRLPVHSASLRIIMGDDGLPAAFVLPDPGRCWAHEPRSGFERFEEVFDGHVDLLIQRLRGQVKIAPKVLWSSVGHYYEWILGEMATLNAPEARLHQGRQLLTASCRPDGHVNPLHDSIRYVQLTDDEPPHRQRKHCCVRYLLPGKKLCGTCPHTANPPAGYQPDAAPAAK